ncbi:MDR family oxidoreductase [Corynebacterium pilosum]|uniref:Zinc-binding dehydrogenase n=1 Tax=Corynebacterium pilosum TaxID=35756 RepID=A0A376CLN1_9CORY|nr:MDR family oxidoreductase [Corynebacterium pilosum]STC69127.1 zinc-binding dehydrogenase [Corynebacterium pilosum]
MTQTLLVTDNGPQLIDTSAEHAGEGDTLMNVTHSSVNYKDGMALAGNKGVVRTLPLVPGIDAVGTVVDSPTLEAGTLVTVNGHGIGERRHGGYTPQMRIDAKYVTPVPDTFDAWTAAAIGTAGYTAALCVLALGEVDGPVLVTGATGGVGSVAVQLLASRGVEVVAATGRIDEHSDWLRELGAAEIIDRAEFMEASKPLQKARFTGAVDTLGSTPLANVLAQVTWGGTVAACGMAAGADLPASVLPFILRGVNLAGVNSVDAPAELREEAWALLAQDLDVAKLRDHTRTVDLEGAIETGAALLSGTGSGRTVVEVQDVASE